MTVKEPGISAVRVATVAETVYDNPVCRNRLQASSTLAYAYTQIKSGQIDLARHVLAGLPTRTEPGMQEVLFCMEVFMQTRSGRYDEPKEQLLHRLRVDPNQASYLSLLQAVIWEEYQNSRSEAAPATPSAVSEVISPAASPTENPVDALDKGPSHSSEDPLDPEAYRQLLDEAGTLEFFGWNQKTGVRRKAGISENLDGLIDVLDKILPGDLSTAVWDLEGGGIHRIVLQFERFTLFSLFRGEYGVALISENLQKAQLSLVRLEKIFRERTQAATSLPGTESSHV